MLTLGLMSGTSMDAVDVAAVEFSDSGCQLVRYRQFPIPAPLKDGLHAAGPDTGIATLVELDARVGELFGHCALELMRECGLDAAAVAAVGSHGQTLLHIPAAPHANTLQVGDPNRIAMITGVRTVADLRRMDMAAGGQGAPLAPSFHAWRFRSAGHARAVINLGGIANISILPRTGDGDVTGFDTGPANTLMDQWTRLKRDKPHDSNGEWAASGTVIPELLENLRAEPYFRLPPPKSTGREYFNLDWLHARAGRTAEQLAPADVQATLLELTVGTIADAVETYAESADEVYVCGGGTFNAALMKRLAGALQPRRVSSTTDIGVPAGAVEAMMVAWLAWRRVMNVPANLPAVTGANRAVILGAIYDPAEE